MSFDGMDLDGLDDKWFNPVSVDTLPDAVEREEDIKARELEKHQLYPVIRPILPPLYDTYTLTPTITTALFGGAATTIQGDFVTVPYQTLNNTIAVNTTFVTTTGYYDGTLTNGISEGDFEETDGTEAI